jgi:hypothetical protein
MDAIDRILERASSPSDTATILIAGTAGFMLDAGLNVIGFLSPGHVGIAAASAALGVKKAIEAGVQPGRDRNRALTRARKLRAFLVSNGPMYLIAPVDREIALLEAGVTDPSSANAALDELERKAR